jgi:uncharacterized protein YjbI with pentapeptide repeats
MNNDEWLALISLGFADWKEWRVNNADIRVDLRGLDLKDEHLSYFDLSGANLRGVSLRGAWLERANLQDADMREAHLTITKLMNANLTGADLRGAQLNNAILRGATLTKVDFSGAILRGADFDGAVLGWTVFGYTDLHSAKNLDKVKVEGPTSIGLDTLELSRWRVPRQLLSNPKLHPDVIAAIERWAGKAEFYYSCFLSHSSLDIKFARKLYDDLRTDGVASWISAEDLPPGTMWQTELRENLKSAERVLVLVTEHSLNSKGVSDEMNEVLVTGQANSRIIPIKVIDDEMWKATDVPWVAALRGSVQAVSFEDVDNDYQRPYRKLLEALKKPSRRVDCKMGRHCGL